MDNSPKTQARTLPLPHLRQAREALGLGVRELHRRTRKRGHAVAQDTIIDLELGRRRAYPSTIRKLAEALGTDPQTLTANYWEMSEKERKAYARLAESGEPQSFFVEEKEHE